MSEAALPLPRRIWWPWDRPSPEGAPVQRLAVRQRFTVGRQALAILYLSASGPCRVWLDGGEATAIEGAGLPSWRAMQRIGMALAPGEHTLSIAAEPGPPPAADRPSFATGGSAQPDSNQPFVLACLDWEESGRPRRIATDATWEMAANPPAGWPRAAGRDAQGGPAWRAAWAFDGVWAEPWGMPCNAPDDFCRLGQGWQTMHAERLVRIAESCQGLTTAGGAASLDAEGRPILRPVRPFAAAAPALGMQRPRLEWYRTREAHSQTNNAWLDLFEARMPHLVFDVGRETFGRVRVQVRTGGPALIAVTTGESLGEVQRYARRVTDIVALRDWEAFITAPTGFRYVKVMALSSGGAAVTLEPVEVQHIRYDAAIAGSFACSDPALDAIWELSAATLHLCMQNEVWDGVKRDQLPWMGDLYTEALAAYHILGDAAGASGDASRLVRHTLAVLAEVGPAPARPVEQARYPGLAAIWRGDAAAPGGHDINGIPSYTMWWLVGLADYLRYTGDTGLIWELAGEIRATLDHIGRSVGEDGLWRLRDGWDFVDWSPMSEGERRAFCHLLATQALGLGAGLLDAIGRNGDAYRRLQARLRDAARRTWWADPAATPFGAGETASHHVNAMAIRSGILTPDEAAALFKRTLAADPPQTMTYWHRYADLDAAGRVGQVQWGLDYIRRHWGHALRGGHTALWEAFDPAWLGSADPHAVSMVGAEHARYGGYETSLCHGWSAGPAVWLHTEVLGVRPAAPGFAAVDFNPALGSGPRGLQWARGTIPTPRGPIRVSLDRRGPEPIAEISAPPDVEVRLSERPRESWRVRMTTNS